MSISCADGEVIGRVLPAILAPSAARHAEGHAELAMRKHKHDCYAAEGSGAARERKSR